MISDAASGTRAVRSTSGINPGLSRELIAEGIRKGSTHRFAMNGQTAEIAPADKNSSVARRDRRDIEAIP